MCAESETRQHREPAKIALGEYFAARLGATQLKGEPDAEKQRKGSMRFAFDQSPNEHPHRLVEPAWVGRAIMKMNDEHPEQRQAAKDVD